MNFKISYILYLFYFTFCIFVYIQFNNIINNNNNNLNITNQKYNNGDNNKNNNYKINNDILNVILPNSFIKNSTTKHTATVIFLHGLGDTGKGWLDVMEMIQKNGNQHIKFICPTAPIQPVTINKGNKMNSWYDIKRIGIDEDNNNKIDFDKSKELVENLIINEIINYGIDSNRIIIGGFSQGCALSLYTFYSQKSIKLAGCLALSGYLPFHTKFSNIIKDSINIDQPLLMFHGEADQVVKYSYARLSFQILKNQNINGDFISFKNMGHTSSREEINYIIKFINKHLPVI